MNKTECYLKLVDIQKDDFNFYGNDCVYELEVYNSKRKLIGTASVPVVNAGTDYSSAFDFIYDYDLNDEDECKNLAELLDVDHIDESWLDEDGDIDADKLPADVCQRITDDEDQMLMECYFDEFAEDTDEDGFLRISDFVENYSFRRYQGDYNKIIHIDSDQTDADILSDMDDYEWYYPAHSSTFDVETTNMNKDELDTALFVQLASSIAYIMDDMDITSYCVDIRFGGDYDRENEAKEVMQLVYIEMAYIIIRSLIPTLESESPNGWKSVVAEMMSLVGKRIGFVYEDSSSGVFSEVASVVYDGLVSASWKVNPNEQIAHVVEELISQGKYPMSDEKYASLIKDRRLDEIN